MKTFSSEGRLLSEELRDYYKSEISFVKIKQLLRGKDIKLNGKRVNKDLKTTPGDEITVYYDGEKREIKVLFKDGNVLAVYKPKGESAEAFSARVIKDYPTALPAHRLDFNTDGILLFSLNEKAEKALYSAFKERTIKKYYLAEVYGKMPKNTETLTAYLKKDASKGKVKIYPSKVDGAVKIITKYKVLEEREETSLIEVELVTGKTHQIRAHLAAVGHFIIGDGKYGKESVNRKFSSSAQRLTAKKIEFFFKDEYLSYLNGRVIEI